MNSRENSEKHRESNFLNTRVAFAQNSRPSKILLSIHTTIIWAILFLDKVVLSIASFTEVFDLWLIGWFTTYICMHTREDRYVAKNDKLVQTLHNRKGTYHQHCKLRSEFA